MKSISMLSSSRVLSLSRRCNLLDLQLVFMLATRYCKIRCLLEHELDANFEKPIQERPTLYLFKFNLHRRRPFTVKTWNWICFIRHALPELLYSSSFFFLRIGSIRKRYMYINSKSVNKTAIEKRDRS